MRIPDTPGGARKVILAGAAGVLLVLTAVLGVPRLAHEVREDDPVAVPECVRESAPVTVDSPDDGGAAAPTPQQTDDPARGKPLTLRVPGLEIDVTVTPVSIGTQGVLVPPSDYTTVGWWSDGAQPGSARGTVLITGHKVRSGGGAFDDLSTLEPGALLHVTTTKGRITYRVVEVENYSKEQLASISERLFSQTAVGQLVLVTCSDYFAGSYHGNTVVIAQPGAEGSDAATEGSE